MSDPSTLTDAELNLAVAEVQGWHAEEPYWADGPHWVDEAGKIVGAVEFYSPATDIGQAWAYLLAMPTGYHWAVNRITSEEAGWICIDILRSTGRGWQGVAEASGQPPRAITEVVYAALLSQQEKTDA